jgi:hypothetical protein
MLAIFTTACILAVREGWKRKKRIPTQRYADGAQWPEVPIFREGGAVLTAKERARNNIPILATLLVGYVAPLCALLAPCRTKKRLPKIDRLFRARSYMLPIHRILKTRFQSIAPKKSCEFQKCPVVWHKTLVFKEKTAMPQIKCPTQSSV